METILDIAALASALIWPLAIVIIFWIYRKAIPDLIKVISGRLTKVEFAGFALELAQAEPFDPDWQNAPDNIDLRHHAQGSQLADSTTATFFQQLVKEDHADYAIVDLGAGREWLSTRLYILSIVFTRAKEIECIVFLETIGDNRKRFLGIASLGHVRWSLAQTYPWLEAAYAKAYSSLFLDPPIAKVTSSSGQLGKYYAQDDYPGATPMSIELLQRFIREVQNTSSDITTFPEQTEWETLLNGTIEAATWLNGEMIENILGKNLKREFTDAKENKVLIKDTLAIAQLFVPVVDMDRRFKLLLKRHVLLEQLGKQELTKFEPEEA